MAWASIVSGQWYHLPTHLNMIRMMANPSVNADAIYLGLKNRKDQTQRMHKDILQQNCQKRKMVVRMIIFSPSTCKTRSRNIDTCLMSRDRRYTQAGMTSAAVLTVPYTFSVIARDGKGSISTSIDRKGSISLWTMHCLLLFADTLVYYYKTQRSVAIMTWRREQQYN